jgi:predicted NACHT family NTPase
MRVKFTPWSDDAGSQGPHDATDTDAPAEEQSQAGDFDSVADAFSLEPRYRRVVLDEAGAGKTVLVTELQRKLVEAPKPGDPVPVIVPAAAWRPDRQSLLDWLGERLAADYGWLPVAHARALVARGMVLPILDGLGEMPRSLRPVAIARINKHHMYRPLVVTSHEEEYRTAARQNHAAVKGSVAVVMQPLLPEDTLSYLDPTNSGGWADVLGDTDAHAGELARVLANPLML